MSNGIKLLLKVVLAIGLLAYLASKMDFTEVQSVVASARWSLVVVAILVHFLTVTLSLLRWSIVVRNFSIRSGLGRLLRFLLIGYYFNLFLPTSVGGDVVRSYYLARQEDTGLPTTLTTTVLDRIIGVFGLLLVGTAGVAVHPISVQGQSLLLLFLVALGGFIICVAILFNDLTYRVLSRLLRPLSRWQIEERIGLAVQGIQRLRSHPGSILSTVALSVVIQLVVVVMTWTAALALGLDAPFLTFVIFVPVINLTTMVVPITINGLGLREAVYYLLFSEIGVPVEQAVVLSLLCFLIMNVPSLIGGVVYLVSDLPSRQGLAEDIGQEGRPDSGSA